MKATPFGILSSAQPCMTVFLGIAAMSSVPLWSFQEQESMADQLLTRQGPDVWTTESASGSAIGLRPIPLTSPCSP